MENSSLDCNGFVLWPETSACNAHGTCVSVVVDPTDAASGTAMCLCDPEWTGVSDILDRGGEGCHTHIPTLRIFWIVTLALHIALVLYIIIRVLGCCQPRTTSTRRASQQGTHLSPDIERPPPPQQQQLQQQQQQQQLVASPRGRFCCSCSRVCFSSGQQQQQLQGAADSGPHTTQSEGIRSSGIGVRDRNSVVSGGGSSSNSWTWRDLCTICCSSSASSRASADSTCTSTMLANLKTIALLLFTMYAILVIIFATCKVAIDYHPSHDRRSVNETDFSFVAGRHLGASCLMALIAMCFWLGHFANSYNIFLVTRKTARLVHGQMIAQEQRVLRRTASMLPRGNTSTAAAAASSSAPPFSPGMTAMTTTTTMMTRASTSSHAASHDYLASTMVPGLILNFFMILLSNALVFVIPVMRIQASLSSGGGGGGEEAAAGGETFASSSRSLRQLLSILYHVLTTAQAVVSVVWIFALTAVRLIRDLEATVKATTEGLMMKLSGATASEKSVVDSHGKTLLALVERLKKHRSTLFRVAIVQCLIGVAMASWTWLASMGSFFLPIRYINAALTSISVVRFLTTANKSTDDGAEQPAYHGRLGSLNASSMPGKARKVFLGVTPGGTSSDKKTKSPNSQQTNLVVVSPRASSMQFDRDRE